MAIIIKGKVILGPSFLSTATVVQRKYNLFTGSNPLVTTLDSPVTEGNFISVQYFGSIQLTDPSTCTSDNGNYVYTGPGDRVEYAGTLNSFYVFNANSGSTTFTCAGIASGPSVIITEYSGVKRTGNPLLSSGQNTGSTTPLQTSIINSSRALLAMGLFNQDLDDYLSLIGPVTLSINTTTGAGEHILIAENLGASPGTNNIGVNTGGSSKNVLEVAAFELESPTQYGILGWNTPDLPTPFSIGSGNIWGCYFDCTQDATAFDQKLRAKSTSGTANVKAGIYTRTGSDSGNDLYLSSETLTLTTTEIVLNFTQNKPLAAGSSYWILFQADADITFWYDTSATPSKYTNLGFYTFGSWPSSFSSVFTELVIVQLWADYSF